MILQEAWKNLENFKLNNPPENSWNKKLGVDWFRKERLMKQQTILLLEPYLGRISPNEYDNPWAGLILKGLSEGHLVSMESIESIQELLIAWHNKDYIKMSLKIPGKFWISYNSNNCYRTLEVIPKGLIGYYKQSLLEKLKEFPEDRQECLLRISDLKRDLKLFYIIDRSSKAIWQFQGKSNDSEIKRKEKLKQKRLEKRKQRRIIRKLLEG